MTTTTRMSTLRTFARRGSAAALALGTSLGISLTGAGSASALSSGEVIGTNVLRNWETGRCLDAAAGDEGGVGRVYTNPCQTGNAHQNWRVIYESHSTYDVVQVKNVATGLCLSTFGGGSTLRTDACSDSFNDYWYGVGSSWDQVSFRNLVTGTCADSDYNGSAYAIGCNDGGFQKWKLGF
ncbi:RICIN domain-containing protein [Streptomyces sp. ME02-8801-2C]|uniref:RICIN domain-containing protein n=1 Tax=Streptomyces sp. ME02-8801-2C TaxID=3028680 RepID=UPI0029AB53C3|nr:RICIN domain-containing protein [Streptomyces sp. ME02-8801-2C]MDX3453717.1 RICIN domain-containing protein [Streptomyces sp. ME02-8801-2C]